MKEGCRLPLCTESAEVLCRLHLMRLAWTCYGKARHTQRFAVREAKRRSERDKGIGQASVHYPCPVCSAYHVGHERPGSAARLAETQDIVRRLRLAGEIRLLSRIAEDWSPARGADRTGHWTDKVTL